MIAYPLHELQQLEIRSVLSDAASQELITEAEEQRSLTEYPSRLYSPNWPVRIGLAILTLVAVQSMSGLLLLMSGMGFSEFVTLPLGLGCITLLEYFIRTKNHYRSGIDDILLYGGLGFLLSFIFLQTESWQKYQPLAVSSAGFLLYGFATLRYLDRFTLLGSMAALAAIFISAWQLAGAKNPLLLHWMIAVTMGFIAAAAWKLKKRPGLRWYGQLLNWTQVIALAACYGALHYFILENLFPLELDQTEPGPIPMAWFYWTWTILFPLVLLWFALRHQDMMKIRLAMLCLLLLPFTLHHYYPLLSDELAATVYGIFLLLLGWALVLYLKKDTSPYSFRTGGDRGELLGENPFLVVAGLAGTGSPDAGTQGTRMGGGSFGGAGAGGDF